MRIIRSPEKLAYVLMPAGVAALVTGQFLQNEILQTIGGLIIAPFVVVGLPLLFMGVVAELYQLLRRGGRDSSPSKEQATGDSSKEVEW